MRAGRRNSREEGVSSPFQRGSRARIVIAQVTVWPRLPGIVAGGGAGPGDDAAAWR